LGAHGALSIALATTLLDDPVALADGVTFDLAGVPLEGRQAQPVLQRTHLALVHSLCYSGSTVALVLAHEE
jgi:hypothetical protein